MRVMIFRTPFARQRIRRTQINLTHLNTFAIRSWVKKFIGSSVKIVGESWFR